MDETGNPLSNQFPFSGSGDISVGFGDGGLSIRDESVRGHWAKIGTASGSLYAHTSVYVDPTGTVVDAGTGGLLPFGTTTSSPAREVNGSTAVASGTYVWLEPTPEGWSFVAGLPGATGAAGSAGFPVRVTAVTSTTVTYQRLKFSSGAWSDDSTSPATGTAAQIQFPGATAWTPVVGDRGTVYSYTSTAGAANYFIPEHGEATTTHRGLVSTGTQTFAGGKTFTGLVVAAGLQSTTGSLTAFSGSNTTVAFSTSLFQIGDGAFYMPSTYVYTNLLLVESDPANTLTDYIITAKGSSTTLKLGSQNGYAILWSPIVYIADTGAGHGLEIKCNSPAADDLLVRWNGPGGLSPANRFKYVASSTRWTFYGTFESDTRFRCNGNDGLTTTQVFKDGSGTDRTMTITGGIVTAIT